MKFLWMALSVIMILSPGCSKTPDSTLKSVTYRLKWLYNTSVLGGLYAKEQGFFKKYGLDVTIKEGGPERDAIKELELGHAQFGTASADQVIRALAKGAPVVVLAQLFQVNPLQWIYRPDQTVIQKARDLEGKKIGVTFGGNDETIFKALLAKHHMAPGAVSLVSVRYDYTPFYTGMVALWPVYLNTQGIVIGEKLAKAGEAFHFFNPAEYGIRFVANSIVTTKRLLEERPELVQRFVTALLSGWREALDPAYKKQAIEMLRRFDRDTAAEIIEKQWAATKTLIQPSPEVVIGHIDREAWEQTENIMAEQNLIPRPVHVTRNLVDLSETP